MHTLIGRMYLPSLAPLYAVSGPENPVLIEDLHTTSSSYTACAKLLQRLRTDGWSFQTYGEYGERMVKLAKTFSDQQDAQQVADQLSREHGNILQVVAPEH